MTTAKHEVYVLRSKRVCLNVGRCRMLRWQAATALLLSAFVLFRGLGCSFSKWGSPVMSARHETTHGIVHNYGSWYYGAKGRGAVCFYGINRSLKHTASSIQRNLLEPITLAGYEFDLFYHTYNLSVIDNPRSKEVQQKVDPSGFDILGRYKGSEISSQEDFLATFNLQDWIIDNMDNWNDNFKSLKNLACQLNSIESCCNLIDSSRQKYKFVIFARPDLLYLNSINMSQVETYLFGKDRVWILPDFHGPDTFWNDRFVVASRDDVQPWCRRIHWGKNFVRDKSQTVHSEMLVKYVGETVGIQKRDIDLKAVRVRANGMINSDGFWLQQWNMTKFIGYKCDGPCI